MLSSADNAFLQNLSSGIARGIKTLRCDEAATREVATSSPLLYICLPADLQFLPSSLLSSASGRLLQTRQSLQALPVSTTRFFVSIQVQTVKMWPVLILNALAFGTFSPFVAFITALTVKSVAMFSNLVLSMASVTVALVSSFFTTLVLEPAVITVEIAQVLRNACGSVISKVFFQITGFFFMAIPSFSSSFESLHSLPDCSNDVANSYSCAKSYMLVLAQNTLNLLALVLPFESTIPLLTMGLLSWLSRPIGNAEETRADRMADKYARKCAINRSHTTAPFLGIVYILAACTGLYDQLRSDSNSLSLTLMMLAIWFFRPVIEQWTFKSISPLSDIERLVTQIQTDKAFGLGFLQLGSQQREQIRELNESLTVARDSSTLR